MKLFIKSMLSKESMVKVEADLKQFGLHCINSHPGELEISENLSVADFEQVRVILSNSGFQLLDDRKLILVEKVKQQIINMVCHIEKFPKIKTSAFLSQKFNVDYNYLSKLFSEATGLSIEHFIIQQKIERVKELLLTNEHSISQISYLLNYSSSSHLSKQFRKVTGYSPSTYKELHLKRAPEMKMCDRCHSYI